MFSDFIRANNLTILYSFFKIPQPNIFRFLHVKYSWYDLILYQEQTTWISQNFANQNKGRARQTAPESVFWLYSRQRFDNAIFIFQNSSTQPFQINSLKIVLNFRQSQGKIIRLFIGNQFTTNRMDFPKFRNPTQRQSWPNCSRAGFPTLFAPTIWKYVHECHAWNLENPFDGIMPFY